MEYKIFLLISLLPWIQVADAQSFQQLPFLWYPEHEGTITLTVTGSENDEVYLEVEHWTTEDDDFDDPMLDPTTPVTIDASGDTDFMIDIADDTVVEEDEHFIVYLYDNEDNSLLDWVLIYITNNDVFIQFAGYSQEVVDEGDQFCVYVERFGYLDAEVSVDIDDFYETAEEADTTETNDDVEFAEGETVVRLCIGNIDTDTDLEDLEQFYYDFDIDATNTDLGGEPDIQYSFGDPHYFRIVDKTVAFSFATDTVFFEEGENVAVPILRSGDLDSSVSVRIGYAAGNSDGTDDGQINPATGTSLTVPFGAGVTAVYWDVAELDDDELLEPHLEYFFVRLASVINTDSHTIIQPSSVKVLIGDRTTTFSFVESTVFVLEGQDLSVRIARFGYLENVATIDIDLDEGTAETDDYSQQITEVTFGESVSYRFSNLVDIDEDDICEGVEFFDMSLSDPTSTGGETIGQGFLRVYIFDQTVNAYFADNTMMVHEGDTVSAYIIREGGTAGTLTITVSLNSGTADDGDDYSIITANTIQFAAGQSAVEFDIANALIDEICEDLEDFYINIDSPQSCGGPDSLQVFILDKTTTLSLTNEVYFITEGETFYVHVERNGELQQDSDVSFTIVDGTAEAATDMGTRASPNDLDYDDQEKVLQHEIFDIEQDDLCEEVEYFDIQLSNPMGGILGYPRQARVYIYDETPQVFFEEARYHVEEGEMVILRLRRRGNTRLTNTIDLMRTDVSADGGGVDYNDLTTPEWTVTFDPGDEYHDRTFTTIRDAMLEDTETFTIQLTNPDDDPFALKSPTLTTIFVEDRTTTYSIEEFQYWVRAGTSLTVRFHRDRYLGQEDTITLSATEDSALSPEDYSLPADTVITFPIGATTAEKVITTTRRHIPSYVERGIERFFISISIDSSDTNSVLKPPSTAEVFIYEEVTNYMFEKAYDFVPESTEDWTFYITRDGPISEAGSVILNTRDLPLRGAKEGIDYEPIVARQIDFLAEQWRVETTVTILPDDLVEGAEAFEVYLSSPDGPALTTNNLGHIHQAVFGIADDDGYFRFSKGLYVVEEVNGTVFITVERFGYNDVEATVVVTTVDQSAQTLVSPDDYTTTEETLEFAACQTEASFTIPIHDDVYYEGGELFRIDLFIVNDGNPEEFVHTDTFVHVDDNEHFYRFSKDFYNVNEADGIVQITVERLGSLRIPSSVTAVTADQNALAFLDYTEEKHRIVFGVEDRSHTFDININNDDIVEMTAEAFRIDLYVHEVLQPSPYTCTFVLIEDDDVTHSLVETSYTVREGELRVVLTVIRYGCLGKASSVDIVVSDITATDGDDYEVPSSSGTITFSPDEVQASFEIDIIDDSLFELTEEFSVKLHSTVAEELKVPIEAIVTIISDDAQCSQVCHNGGFCSGNDECSCPREFEGPQCQSDVNECQLVNTDVCPGVLQCVNTFGGYECRCDAPGLYRLGNECIPIREISGQMTIVEVNGQTAIFLPNLGDTTSDDFIQLAATVENALLVIFQNVPELLDITITGFFQGSIVARFILTLRENSPVTATDVSQLFDDDVALMNGIIVDPTFSEQLRFGVDVCSFTVCQNGGTCTFDNDLRAVCICPSGFQGQYCEIVEEVPEATTSSSGLSLFVILAIAFGALFFVLFIFCCIGVCYCLRFGRGSGQEAVDFSKGTEQSPDGLGLLLNRPQEMWSNPNSPQSSSLLPAPNFSSMQQLPAITQNDPSSLAYL